MNLCPMQMASEVLGSKDKRLDHAALTQSMVMNNGTHLLLVFDGADEVKDLPPILQDLL